MVLSRSSGQGAVLLTCNSEDSWVVVDYDNVCLALIYLPLEGQGRIEDILGEILENTEGRNLVLFGDFNLA